MAAAGTNQTWVAGTHEWQIQVGMAAQYGIVAARLAAAGCTGAPDALEGKAGFYTAFMGDVEQISQVGKDLGTVWRCLDVTYLITQYFTLFGIAFRPLPLFQQLF